MDLGLRVMIRPLRLRDFRHCDVKEAMDKIAGAPHFQRMRRKASPDKVAAERWAKLFEGSSISFGRSYKQWNAWTGRFEEYQF